MEPHTNGQAAVFAALTTLRDAGLPLIEIRRGEKRPVAPDWTNFRAIPTDLARWAAEHCSVGLLTCDHPAIDIDVTDPELNRAVRETLERVFGETLVYRVGNSPKAAVICRTRAPFPKMRFELYRGGTPLLDTNGRAQAIEILGKGQQVVIHGLHAATHQPYCYEHGDQRGGVELLATSVDKLPEIDADCVTTKLVPALAAALQLFRVTLTPTVGTTTTAVERAAVDQEDLRAPSLEALREAVACIPNTIPDRAGYIKTLAAIRAAAGDEIEAGLALALEWAARWTGGVNHPAVVEHDYRTLPPPHAVGWSWLAGNARENGFNDAAFDFDVSEIAPSTTVALPGVARAPTPLPLPLPTEGERIAALHRTAERALLLELPTIPDGALWARIEQLEAAAQTVDPLARDFPKVLKVATSLHTYAADEQAFDSMLRNLLGSQHSDDERLLRRAAWALVAPKNALNDQLAASPGSLSAPTEIERNWIIEDFAAPGWVGALIGESSGGKTFAATYLTAQVAGVGTGCFGGHAVRGGSVLYCPSEDRDGVRERIQRYGEVEHVYIAERAIPLSNLLDALAFTRQALSQIPDLEAHPLQLVVIDTLSGALGAGNENDVQVMAPALRVAKLIARLTGAFVLVLHHVGHGNPDRGRGSSAFNAELDVGFLVKKADDNITLTNCRLKTGPQGEILRFHIGERGALCAGSATQTAVHDGEPDSHHVVRAMREISLDEAGVTKTDIKAALATKCPHRFGETIARETVRDRLNRALREAFGKGWIRHLRRRGADRLVLDVDPPEVPLLANFDLPVVEGA